MANAIHALLNQNSEKRPLFTPEKCLNRRQRKFTCTLCHDLCPAGVFSLKAGEGLEWDKCTGCGLCTAACPSRCFAPPAGAQREYLQDMDLSQPVTFSCYKESRLCDKTVECLGGVPWELFAVIAMHTDIVLYIGECQACPAAGRAERLQKNMEQLRDFLGDNRFAARVHLLHEGSFIPADHQKKEEKKLTRRDIFSNVKKTVAKEAYQAAVTRIPLLDDVNPEGLQYRKLLSTCVMKEREKAIELKAEGNDPESVPLPAWGARLPKFTEKCFGCDICEKVCPQKAIELEPEKGGKRIIFITPYKCTACELCVKVCPYGGLAGIGVVQAPYFEKLPLVKVNAADCEQCGRPIRPGKVPKLCAACAAKAAKLNTKQVQPTR